jgi:hypothetical protein
MRPAGIEPACKRRCCSTERTGRLSASELRDLDTAIALVLGL